MSAFPGELGVKATEQLAVPEAPEGFNVQLDPEKVPCALLWKKTVPEGVTGDPTPPVSVTVTVHVVAKPWATGFGLQLTVVETERWLTFKLVFWLFEE